MCFGLRVIAGVLIWVVVLAAGCGFVFRFCGVWCSGGLMCLCCVLVLLLNLWLGRGLTLVWVSRASVVELCVV